MKTCFRYLMLLISASGIALGGIVIKDGDSIAFLGDSLTQLGNDHKPNGYVHLVIEGLQTAGVNATPIPAGIGGNTTRDMLARLDRDVISKKPTWMTLNSGINDSPRMDLAEFSANLAEIVDRTTSAGIKVILITTTIGSGENLESPETAKRKTFADAFIKLGKERGLMVVDMNSVMARELRERKQDGVKGLKLTYDGTHLNGLGNQIMAAEILRTMGVPDPDLTALRERWNDYPFALAEPEISINDFIKLKALADRNGKTVEEQVSMLLTASVAGAAKPSTSGKVKVMQDWDDSSTNDLPLIALKDGDKLAILSGQSFETWGWGPSGYMRLVTDQFERAGGKNPISICYEGKKTEQMLALLDEDVIAKKPAYVLIIPGTSDYNVFAEKTVHESFTANLTQVIGKLQTAKIQVILATSYAVNSNPTEARNRHVIEHNEAIRVLARGHQVPLIDFVQVVDSERPSLPLDGSLAAKALINQMFAGEVLRTLGESDQEIAASRQAWLDLPGIKFTTSVSVNNYEKLKAAAAASGMDVNTHMTSVLHAVLNL